MKNPQIELFIVKFLNNEATQEELIKLNFWLRDNNNTTQFNQFVKTHYLTTVHMNKFDVEKARTTVKEKIEMNKKRSKIITIKKYIAVASIALLVALTFLFKNQYANTTNVILQEDTITPGVSKATLTLENGKHITLGKGNDFKTKNSSSDGEKLIYTKSSNVKNDEIAYNYLTIPRGAQFFVRLSDGTEVWLNSDSKLKYPVIFNQGILREVELVYGEAYFDVSPSSENQGSKFMVRSRIQGIEVFGTEFNVKSNKEVDKIYTTLVEGSITIDNGVSSNLLLPGEQAILDVSTETIEINKDVDIYNEVSWKNGFFSFDDKALTDIMQVLGKWYDVDITFENKAVEKIRFSGVFNRNQNLEDILFVMQNTKEASFEIKETTVIIK